MQMYAFVRHALFSSSVMKNSSFLFCFSFALATIDSLSFKYQIIKLFALFSYFIPYFVCQSIQWKTKKKEKKKEENMHQRPIQYICNEKQINDELKKKLIFIKWNAANAKILNWKIAIYLTVLFGMYLAKQNLQL